MNSRDRPGFFSEYVAPGATTGQPATTAPDASGDLPQQSADVPTDQIPTGSEGAVNTKQITLADGTTKTVDLNTAAGRFQADIAAGQAPSATDSLKSMFTPNDGVGFFEGGKELLFPTQPTTASMLPAGVTPATATSQQLALAAERAAAAAPGFLRTYGPLAAVGTGAAVAGGMFETPEMEEPGLIDYGEDGQPITGEDLIASDPGKYLVKNIGKSQLNEETGQYEPITNYTPVNMNLGPRVDTGSGGITAAPMPDGTVMANAIAPTFNPNQYFLRGSQPGGPFARPVMAAEGGPIYPRRNGGIMPNEGVPGEDSVRAMLMPGEFVMTKDAVRGIGNGNLNQGIQNMYSVMRNLESRGRQMA